MTALSKLTTLATPYSVYIKLVVLALTLAIGVWLGFKLDTDVDCGTLDAETATEIATLRTANAAWQNLEDKRAQLAAQQEETSARMRQDNQQSISTAYKSKESLDKTLKGIERRHETAMSKPQCAELLELEVCDAL